MPEMLEIVRQQRLNFLFEGTCFPKYTRSGRSKGLGFFACLWNIFFLIYVLITFGVVNRLLKKRNKFLIIVESWPWLKGHIEESYIWLLCRWCYQLDLIHVWITFFFLTDKFWFWKLAPNHKALHYGDCGETERPRLEDLSSKCKYFFNRKR